MGRSFGLFIALRCTCLGSGRDLIVCRTVLVLAVGLEVLVVVAIGVVVSVLLWAELVHLLRACAKLVWAAITSHSHYELLVGCRTVLTQSTYCSEEVAGCNPEQY